MVCYFPFNVNIIKNWLNGHLILTNRFLVENCCWSYISHRKRKTNINKIFTFHLDFFCLVYIHNNNNGQNSIAFKVERQNSTDDFKVEHNWYIYPNSMKKMFD